MYSEAANDGYGRIKPPKNGWESIRSVVEGKRPVAEVSDIDLEDAKIELIPFIEAVERGDVSYMEYTTGIWDVRDATCSFYRAKGVVVFRAGEEALANELVDIYTRFVNIPGTPPLPHRRIGEIFHYREEDIDEFCARMPHSLVYPC